MPIIVWTDELAIGIGQIDAQHRKLIHLLNLLHEGVTGHLPLHDLRELTAELTLHTRIHFSDEEMIMEGAEYPALAAHRRLHLEFVENHLRLARHLRLDRPAQFQSVVHLESAWISKHVSLDDAEFGRWFHDHSRGYPFLDQGETSSVPTIAAP